MQASRRSSSRIAALLVVLGAVLCGAASAEDASFDRAAQGAALGPFDERFSAAVAGWLSARERC